MLEKNAPIGVFDSGIGGLTVLKQLIRFMPYEKYIYLGDTARVPYGSKSDSTVKLCAEDCTKFLLNKKVKLIVVACNTVSAVALETVKNLAGEIPVIGMIQPAAIAAIRSSNSGKIGIIGTRATIQSNAYAKAIFELSSQDSINVFSQECPLFVPFVEEGFLNHQATRQIAEEYLTKLINKKIDTLVLGCTHYPMLSQLIRDIVPNVVQIDSGEHSAVFALRLLAEKMLLVDEKTDENQKIDLIKHDNNIEFYVTDYPNHFYGLSKNFLGFSVASPILVNL